jgi:hypothetical protein
MDHDTLDDEAISSYLSFTNTSDVQAARRALQFANGNLEVSQLTSQIIKTPNLLMCSRINCLFARDLFPGSCRGVSGLQQPSHIEPNIESRNAI